MTTQPGRLPDAAIARIREFLASGVAGPEPKHAASTILLRTGAAGPEVFFLRRSTGMAFAGGMVVFPGGGVDPRDAGDAVPWSGPSAAAWADRLGVDEDTARGVVCAAARELFEEAGVLLAGPDSTAVAAGADAWDEDRRRLEARETAFSELLRERDLVLRTDLLVPWSCWITPEFETRRYRTWFFAAEVPGGQEPRDGSRESEEVVWMPVADALAAAGDGSHPTRRSARHAVGMLPPQHCTCLELAEYAGAAEALAAAAATTPPVVLPRAVERGDEVELELPGRYRELAARH